MERFKTQVDLVSNSNNTFSVDYSIFAPGKRYSQGTITQTQINSYDSETNAIPGVKVEIMLDEDGPGNPTTFSGSFNVNASLELSGSKPFLEIVYLVMENNETKEKGRAIVRHVLPA